MPVPTSIQVAKTTIGELDVCEITTGDVDGTGIFDSLMRSVNSHLIEQFEKGRITGSDFASVYTAAISATLEQAIKLASEKQLMPYEIMAKEREILKQDYELNELLPNQNLKLEKENLLLDSQLNVVNYELTNKLPAEVVNITKQGLLLDAQTDELAYRVSDILPVEKSNLTYTGENLQMQKALATYELNTKLPAEVSNITKQGLLLDAQEDEIAYRLANIIPVEKANLEFTGANLQAENALLVSKLTTETKQQSSIDAQIATTNAQTELYEQKTTTELAQVDGSVILPNSAMYYQNKLIKAQTDAFTTDSIQKSTKLLLDTWNARHVSDFKGNPPDGFNKLHDKNIGEAVTTLMESAGMTPQTYP